MMMKKGIIAGVGALMLIGGGIFGISSVFADQNQPASVQTATANTQSTGKLSQYKDQILQLHKLQEDRLDLRKQILEKTDQLTGLVSAAKSSGNKAGLKQARAARLQVKVLNQEIKNLTQQAKTERQALKQALKNKQVASSEYQQLISTGQQINQKMSSKLNELNKVIGDLSSNTNT